ncbi:hypothetical protein DUNSADRAFT_5173 [Dunaliella salina]|uniref:Uncharacterized protein n=1 Tax=Dunaliella salina TaxID=3046 RepID=A0ABQ7H7G9_DUNSA|nr:hypothetical protein DUNSADRAFT_5173 [Dunaliella salina]|eukprot:KAF5842801.1 hypothetical protein DUNSADRAFT_5173 [Dunaliella salina]
MDIHARLSSLLQKALPNIPLQPSAALYIFRPASADKISLGSLLFILLVFSKLPSCAYILLLLLTVHIATTCLLHIINTAKLQTAEELLSPAQSQVQLLKVKNTKLEAVIDQVSGLRASIAAAQQQEQELASAKAQLDNQQKDLQKVSE